MLNIHIFRAGFVLFVAVAAIAAFSQEAAADPRAKVGFSRHPDFRVPSPLRARVDFWIDIFTRYGKHNAVLHHRQYPQVVFKVLDFNRQAETMNPVQLARYRKQKIKKEANIIYDAMRHLGAGKPAATPLQKLIVHKMQIVPGGKEKYREVVKEEWVRSQTGIKEKFRDAVIRSGRYLPTIERIFVKEHGMPIELTRMPFVESSFDYTAYSSVGAAGIWQFMPRTGRMFLTINNAIDERRDPVEATSAAAKYLKRAYNQLGTWPLAVTAYNHGAYGVKRKVAKLGTKDIVKIVEHPTQRLFGFASNNFWPELLAALDVYDHYEAYFPDARPEPALRWVDVSLSHPLTVASLQKRLGIDKETLQRYNYAPSSKTWRSYYPLPRGYTLRLPVEYRGKLSGVLRPDPKAEPGVVHASSIYGGMKYRVRRGDTLSGIARRYRTSVSKIKRLNNLRSDLLRVGQQLIISEREGSHGSTTSGVYKVRRGDSLYKIARAYGTSISALKKANNLRSDRLYVGQKLRIAGKASTGGNYRVQRGDSLWAISKRHGVSVASLKKANNMRGNRIKPGMVLRIP